MSWIKRLLGTDGAKSSKEPNTAPEIRRVAPTDNPWHVEMLDIRGVTHSMQSASKNPVCAANAVSFGQDDGTGFIGLPTRSQRRVPADLRYHLDGPLVDGALFLPQVMEHKWALYYHRGKILFIRSWTRQVEVLAEVQTEGGWANITTVQGVITAEDELPEFTIRVLDFILRSHALGLLHPAPVPAEVFKDGREAALWCVSVYGRLAAVAVAEPIPFEPPEPPLHTYSLFHIAAAKSDLAAMSQFLSQGIPIDLPDRDGKSPLDWALSGEGLAAATFLLDRGAPVDFRDPEGATALKQMVQLSQTEKAKFLLARGANPNAGDNRGFTALHVAAYMGNHDMVADLLEHGADASLEIEGQTPRSLAESNGHRNVLAVLSRQTS